MITLRMYSREQNVELALDNSKQKDEGIEPTNEGIEPTNEGIEPSNPNGINKAQARRKRILNLIEKNNDVTTYSLARDIDTSEATIERDIAWLKRNGLIERDGSKRFGKWVVLKSDLN